MPYIQQQEKERYPDSYRDKNFQFFFASLRLCNFAFKIIFFITNYCNTQLVKLVLTIQGF